MKRFAVALFATFIGITIYTQDAEAARLGGGRSFGMSRSSTPVKQAAPAATPAAPSQSAVPAKPAAAPAAAPQPSGMSRWLGPIAGIAAGLGIAALLSHFGLGEGMASILMILLLVGAAVFVFRLLFRRKGPQPAYAGGATPMRFEPLTAPGGGHSGTAPASAANVPAGFDTEGFLRQAKLSFIRLQAANDSGNLDDLKQFTAPEVFAEIQMQFEERGRGKQETDVVNLDGELLELVTEAERHVASVRFSGEIRESAGGPVQAFAEVWHLSKPVSGGGGWLVAGIQQIQ